MDFDQIYRNTRIAREEEQIFGMFGLTCGKRIDLGPAAKVDLPGSGQ